jgi:phosphoglycerate kinase
MTKLTVRDLTDLRRKRVLMRADFNVPLDKDGNLTDDTRIRETLPTIEFLREQGAIVVLMSHLGRPDGQKIPAMSLRPVAQRLAELLYQPVAFVDDCLGEKALNTVGIAQPGDVILLENVRFYAGEEANDAAFAKQLAALGDLYVNDAFGAAHRAHASTVGVTKFLQPCAAGLLLEKELKFLGDELARPARPFVVVLGGAKVSDKIGVINNLLGKADAILIGGAMAYTFLKAQGIGVGHSKVEDDKLPIARELIEKAARRNVQLLLPADHLAARPVKTDKLDKKGRPIIEFRDVKPTPTATIEDGWAGVDIGPRTLENYKGSVQAAKTVLWNGPMGIFENPEFAHGTFEIAHAIAGATARGAKSIVGGGDSVTAVKAAKVADKMTFISTGGGASLEFLEGKILPGVAALTDR